MTKDVKKLLEQVLTFTFIIFSFYIWKTYFHDLWWMLFVLLIIAGTLPSMILSFVPTKKTKKKTKRRPTTNKKKPSTAKKQPVAGNNNDRKNIDKLLTYDLKRLSGDDFETLCYLYFKAHYKEVEQTKRTKDKGVDIIFKDKDGFKVAVQVKHRYVSKNNVTVREINELNGARRNHRCQKALFITSAGYTRDALRLADEQHIKTYGYEWVENKILKWRMKEAKKRKLI